MAILIYPDGSRFVVEPKNGRYFTLAEKSELVPSHNETVFLDERQGLLCASSGNLRNGEAERIAKAYDRGSERIFRGPVLMFWLSEFESGEEPLHGEYAERELRRLEFAEKPLPLTAALREDAPWPTN